MQTANEVVAEIDSRRQKRDNRKEKNTLKQNKKKVIGKIVKYVFVITCLLLLFLNASLIFRSSNENQPLRIGTYDTDTDTDECIRILWNISKLIQQGKRPGESFKCPKSGKPFQVIESETDIIVRSPAPDLYGFKDIRVTKEKPVPELVK
ncbi:MAG: hypothetical protein PVG39_20130 [Desulfobacteraceae bacterium]